MKEKTGKPPALVADNVLSGAGASMSQMKRREEREEKRVFWLKACLALVLRCWTKRDKFSNYSQGHTGTKIFALLSSHWFSNFAMPKFEHFLLNLWGFLPPFFPTSNPWFFNFSWRIWLHPALAGARLGEKVTSPSSAVASHHHLPGKNWHHFKSPAVNCSADCSLTWFSQTHQVQLKHVNICLSKAPTRCWSRPGSCQPQPLSPLSPYLPTRDQHLLRSATLTAGVFFNTSHFRVLGMQYS